MHIHLMHGKAFLATLALLLTILISSFLLFTPVIPALQARLAIPGTCPSPVLTTLPIAGQDFGYLVPLGNLNPPDHALPTDHIYYVFNRADQSAPVPVHELLSPGAIVVTDITRATTIKSGQIFSNDYKISFSPCSPVNAYYDHITALSPSLAARISKLHPSCSETHPRPSDTYRYCQLNVSLKIGSGEAIGQVGGGRAAGFDFGATDARSPKLAYTNPSRYRGDEFHTICPFDLYSPSLRTEIEPLFRHQGPGPACGEVAQDKTGTAQGNWFQGKRGTGSPESWQDSLALAHSNTDTTVGTISIGGHIASPQTISFQPRHTGTLNREFGEIRPGPEIYCYHSDASGGVAPGTSRTEVALQLIDATHLRIAAASCPIETLPASALTYGR